MKDKKNAETESINITLPSDISYPEGRRITSSLSPGTPKNHHEDFYTRYQEMINKSPNPFCKPKSEAIQLQKEEEKEIIK